MPTQTTFIQFGEWTPDMPNQAAPGLTEVLNAIPIAGGYKPFPSFSQGTGSFTGRCMGAEEFSRPDTSMTVGGTETTLFTRIGGSTSVTSPYTAVPSGEHWDFAQFGTYLFATSITNNPQYIDDFTTSTSWITLTGSPPMARYCERVGDFLLLGNLATGANEIAWSSFNNPTGSWAADRLSQAGQAEVPFQLGDITGLVGGRYGLIFQERGISRLEYVGPPGIWSRPEVSSSRGCIAPASIVTVGYMTYFLSADGFYVTDGSSVQPIGQNKVSRTFFNFTDQSRIKEVQGAVDWQNQCIVWAFYDTENATRYNAAMIYSWAEGKWSIAEIDADWLVTSRRDATSLEDLDALFGDLESVEPHLDSAQWKAGLNILGAFQQDNGSTVYGTFSGTPGSALFKSGYFRPDPIKRVYVSEAEPVVDTTTSNGWVVGTFGLNENWQEVLSAPGRQISTRGIIPQRGNGRGVYFATVTLPGTEWTTATGLQVRYRIGGRR